MLSLSSCRRIRRWETKWHHRPVLVSVPILTSSETLNNSCCAAYGIQWARGGGPCTRNHRIGNHRISPATRIEQLITVQPLANETGSKGKRNKTYPCACSSTWLFPPPPPNHAAAAADGTRNASVASTHLPSSSASPGGGKRPSGSVSPSRSTSSSASDDGFGANRRKRARVHEPTGKSIEQPLTNYEATMSTTNLFFRP